MFNNFDTLLRYKKWTEYKLLNLGTHYYEESLILTLIIDIIKKTRVQGFFYIFFDLEECLIVEQLLLTHLIGKHSEEDIKNFLNNCILSSLREKTKKPLITAVFCTSKPKKGLALFCSPGIKDLVK